MQNFVSKLKLGGLCDLYEHHTKESGACRED